MPVSNAHILGGLILAFFVLGMIQYAVVFLVGIAVGLNLGSDPVAIVLIMMAFTLTTGGLTFVLANFIRTEQQAGSLTTLLGLTLAPLGGAWWPLEIVPDFMRTIGHLSPVAWAMDGFRELIFFDGTLADVWLYIVILLGYAIVLFAFGVYRFSYE
ncbi:MAG: ABC transporter permease [Chloroflexi bacterium]|nr:MAG: ABC transporter permease [Chloroflexota bacterium]